MKPSRCILIKSNSLYCIILNGPIFKTFRGGNEHFQANTLGIKAVSSY